MFCIILAGLVPFRWHQISNERAASTSDVSRRNGGLDGERQNRRHEAQGRTGK